jgi:glutamate-1-semialdehyde 2,1-aminomutase
MEREKSWEMITETGNAIRTRWVELANKYGLKIQTAGLPALSAFGFESEKALAYKTLITQEMLKRGFIAGNSIYVCTEHTGEVLAPYFENLEEVFSIIKTCEDGRPVLELLEGPVCHGGFKRLN